MKKFFATSKNYGALILRVGAGLTMFPFGLQKIQTFDQTIGFMTGAGIPWIIAALVIVAESLGAVSLILGFCTRFSAASLAVVMAGAVYFTFGKGYMMGYATPLLFFIMFLPLVINGAGAWSVDKAIAKKIS